MSKISVIVPVYNSQQYLCRCIDSILAQTFYDFELLLIDDGSTDSSGVICDEYAKKDSRISVFHKINEGVSVARNLGLDNAKGEYITFIDSDDWVEPIFFDHINKYSDVDYIITSYYKHSHFNSFVKECFAEDYISCIDSLFFAEEKMILGFFTPWAKFFKRTIIHNNNLKFNSKISSGEDTLFIYQYLLCINSVYMSNVACYNWTEFNGLSKKNLLFDEIIFTIDLTIESLKKIESKYNCILLKPQYNGILYLISRINMSAYSIKSLYNGLKKLSMEKWMKSLVRDKTIIIKGKRRKLVDFLFVHQLYILLVIYCKLTNRLYE